MREKIQLGLVISLATFLRWCVTFHDYSGKNKPPMYGDYEAQRHWQEITYNLPVDQWYSNSSDNDLQYWGLDYPPLTAFHSLILGKVANEINPDYVKLHNSRGYETSDHKQFMRLSVLIADLIIYVPAIVFLLPYPIFEPKSNQVINILGLKRLHLMVLTALLYPGLILIDHGHFQYNSISLGFFMLSLGLIIKKSLVLGSFFFVLALNYKQMELYHALPIFFFILNKCTPFRNKSILFCLKTFVSVTLTVLTTFSIIWLPFFKDMKFIDVFTRMFPLSRGVFEDKVANAWCTINIFIKLRELFSHVELAKICFFTTILSVLPSGIDLYLNASVEKLILSLINTSLGFYLFSFQVHEKTILLVAIPVLTYFHYDPLPCFWFLIVSSFSLVPLLIKDGLFGAFMSLMTFYYVLNFWIWYDQLNLVPEKRNEPRDRNQSKLKKLTMWHDIKLKINVFFLRLFKNYQIIAIKRIAFYLSILGIILLSLVTKFVRPPRRYPDLYTLLISVYSFAHFFLFFVYFNLKQILLNGNDVS